MIGERYHREDSEIVDQSTGRIFSDFASLIKESKLPRKDHTQKEPTQKEPTQKKPPYKYAWVPPNYGFHRVEVDGSLRKNASAGYGVMVRDNHGKPIAAASDVSPPNSLPSSYLLLQLQAVKKGLELAVKCGCDRVRVLTNSDYTAQVIWRMSFPSAEDSDPVVPVILDEIDRLQYNFRTCYINMCCKQTNMAACYLSKLHEKNEFDDVLPEELSKIAEQDVASSVYYDLPDEVIINVGATVLHCCSNVLVSNDFILGDYRWKEDLVLNSDICPNFCSPDSLLLQLAAVYHSFQGALFYKCRIVRVLIGSTYSTNVIWGKTQLRPEDKHHFVSDLLAKIDSLLKLFDNCFIHSCCWKDREEPRSKDENLNRIASNIEKHLQMQLWLMMHPVECEKYLLPN